MKKNFFILSLIIIITMTGQNLNADLSFQLDFTSRYIWRGFDLNPHEQPALQPSINYTFKDTGLTFNIWSSISFADKEVNEIDFTLTYTFLDSDIFSLSAGFINYSWFFADNFKIKDDTTQEIFISADLKDIFLNPGLCIYYDFGNGDGFYILTKVSQRIKISKSGGIDLFVSLGYNGGQWLADGAEPGFSDMNLGISYPFYLKYFKITPFINYTNVLMETIGSGDHYWFGISINYDKNNYPKD